MSGPVIPDVPLTDIDLRCLLEAYARNPSALFSDAVVRCLRELQQRRANDKPATDRKVAARDVHYALIEEHGLRDDSLTNHAVRSLLERLAR